MARVRRARTVAAAPGEVWRVVSDPRRLAAWWPGVERVEDATEGAWTAVFRSSKGKALRADFTRTAADPPTRVEWRQEVEESPFERFMSEATTAISLAAAGAEQTRVEIRAHRRLRGLARLGGPLVRRATRRQLDQALAGLGDLATREHPERSEG